MTEYKPLIVVTGIILVATILGCWATWYFFMAPAIPAIQANMTVESKEWERTVEYIERYWDTKCQWNARITGQVYECKQVTQQHVLNKWTEKGHYPDNPIWPEYPEVQTDSNHWLEKKQYYRITFSNDGPTYVYTTHSQDVYNKLELRDIRYVSVNRVGTVINAR